MTARIIEPDELESLRGKDDVVIVDLSQPPQYVSAHIPEAHHLAYGLIVRTQKPVVGLLPEAEVFSRILSNLGIGSDTHVVAYDDEGGGSAARLIWTLSVYGHNKASLLNGGIFSWANEGHEVSNIPPVSNTPTDYTVENTGNETTELFYIQQNLKNDKVALLDARSADEYSGKKRLAEKAGHIPGAKHFEWTDAMDRNNNMRMLPAETLRPLLHSCGLSSDKEIICYCQSHHRSAYSWLMLKALGYDNVRGYPGSWSDWGNRADMPVEI